MSIRGRVVFECDCPKCCAELVLDAEDADLDATKRGDVSALFVASGWLLDDGGELRCEQCQDERREPDEDDGCTYSDPRDEREERRS